MALTAYVAATQRLLQNPLPVTGSEYSTADLTTYINTARSWAAGEGRCVRDYSSLTLAAGTRTYAFSSITVSAAGVTAGIGSVLNIDALWVNVGAGQVWTQTRPWPWFSLYHLNNPAPQQGQPTMWSQFGQGVSGTLFVDPVPDQPYVAPVATVCLPTALADDSTAEALPYPWTDAVPFGAAYYALLSAQREQDAELMLNRFKMFVAQARRVSNSDVVPNSYAQHPDMTLSNKLGLKFLPQSGG